MAILSKHGEIPSRHSPLVIEKVIIIREPLAHQCIVALFPWQYPNGWEKTYERRMFPAVKVPYPEAQWPREAEGLQYQSKSR